MTSNILWSICLVHVLAWFLNKGTGLSPARVGVFLLAQTLQGNIGMKFLRLIYPNVSVTGLRVPFLSYQLLSLTEVHNLYPLCPLQYTLTKKFWSWYWALSDLWMQEMTVALIIVMEASCFIPVCWVGCFLSLKYPQQLINLRTLGVRFYRDCMGSVQNVY